MTSKKFFSSRRKIKCGGLTPTEKNENLPGFEFYQWFGAMLEQFEDFGIPCKHCYPVQRADCESTLTDLQNDIDMIKIATCTLFDDVQKADHEIATLTSEIEHLENEVESLVHVNLELKDKEHAVRKAGNIVNKNVIQFVYIEGAFVEMGMRLKEKVIRERGSRYLLSNLPAQKVSTWDQLFRKSLIIPDTSSMSFINKITRAKPIPIIFGMLYSQLKCLANMLNYEYQCAQSTTFGKQTKDAFVLIPKDFGTTKKYNRMVLQCFLKMLLELSNVLLLESGQMFFLVYKLTDDSINGMDFLAYDSKKWFVALECFLTNTETCYKWILRLRRCK
ncbi:hypothetical protein EIN_150970 [Entamoeba invadens IP1]|uniref:Uncharacterized protein n=1 Tax=Entamoeba invadens IP1 TaxID=370355 RepID=A0A0A1U8F3_ENTIV|nr:hypothetical protein EIN_150970 [Entamoeba invadens IP1]ELP91220.1 hypothetical protein EIN_150970 [Entamoeba invadens IP1]|eukprot:XP_004257991.1 hypothetical protein EIN_150970 [Entamoeba invadens IP1]